MSYPTFSIIIPTCGRVELRETLESILAQPMLAGDEVIINRNDDGDWGQKARNRAMQQARGSHLLFIDDDDLYLHDAFAIIRKAVAANPLLPHIFAMKRTEPHRDVLPKKQEVTYGNVSTQMVCVPNDPSKLGMWGNRYEGDLDFIVSTTKNYPRVVWVDSIIVHWRRLNERFPIREQAAES